MGMLNKVQHFPAPYSIIGTAMHTNVNGKIIRCDNSIFKSCSCFFLLWIRGCWWRQLTIVSVGQGISWPGDSMQQCNWKNKIVSCQFFIKQRKGWEILTCAHDGCFSLWWRRECWWQQLVIVSVGQDISWPVDGAQQCNWKKINC